MENFISTGEKVKNLGSILIRYSLAAILIYIGALKFTQYEAEGIKPLVENGVLSWGYSFMSVQGFSKLIGVIEILIGILIASRFLSPKISAIASIGACFMFLVTLSFIFTTPGMFQDGYGFPFLSPMPGQFAAKDIVLLAASIWTLGDALMAVDLQKN